MKIKDRNKIINECIIKLENYVSLLKDIRDNTSNDEEMKTLVEKSGINYDRFCRVLFVNKTAFAFSSPFFAFLM